MQQTHAQETTPSITPEAQKLIENMVARYNELKSYSDYTEVQWEDAAQEPTRLEADLSFGAILTWQRPATIRFEGTRKNGSFLAIGDDKNLFVVSSDHPGYYVKRPRYNFELDGPLMELPVGGPGLGFITDPTFWQRESKNVRALSLAPDAKVEGEDCHVVTVQLDFDAGETSSANWFIAKKDGLLRRMELTAQNQSENVRIIETHSKVQTNLDYPPSTWEFKAPQDAKPIDSFFALASN